MGAEFSDCESDHAHAGGFGAGQAGMVSRRTGAVQPDVSRELDHGGIVPAKAQGNRAS